MFYSHILLLDFWATTCGSCRPVLKTLQALHVRFRQMDILSVPLDGPETQADVKPLLHQQGVTYRVSFGYAHNQQLAKRFDVNTYPALILLDRQGKICWSHSGPLTQQSEDALVRRVSAFKVGGGPFPARPAIGKRGAAE